MTLALGVLCSGAVVLGVDTEISVDGGKIGGPKIQVFWESLPDYNVVSASCGHADSVETARVEIAEALSKLKETTSCPVVREVRRTISDALSRVYVQHIDPLPTQEERNFMDFTLLLAIRVGRTARLFRTNRAQVVEQKTRWCMGSGKEFADYAFGLLLGDNHPSAELVAQLAVYVIDVTKDHIEGVGHFTDVHVIQSNGQHWSVSAPDVKETEIDFAEFFKTLRAVLHTIDSRFSSEDSIQNMLGFLGDKIKVLRAAQDKRIAFRFRMEADAKEELKRCRSPTGDQ